MHVCSGEREKHTFDFQALLVDFFVFFLQIGATFKG